MSLRRLFRPLLRTPGSTPPRHRTAPPLRTVGQKPVKAAKTRSVFRPPESLNSSGIERMTPSMDSLFSEQSIDGVIRQIRAPFNDPGHGNMPRVSASFTGLWPTLQRRSPAPRPPRNWSPATPCRALNKTLLYRRAVVNKLRLEVGMIAIKFLINEAKVNSTLPCWIKHVRV